MLCIGSVVLSACRKDFFDLEDPNGIDSKIWDDEGAKCTFYTVKQHDSDVSETDIFFERYDAKPEYRDANRDLLSFVVYAIGEEHGAIDELFNRYENEVTGLPVQGKRTVESITYHYPDFPLR